MSKKYGIQKANQNQHKKTFPEFVTITETIAVEEITTKDGCVRRRAYAKQVRVAQSSQPRCSLRSKEQLHRVAIL